MTPDKHEGTDWKDWKPEERVTEWWLMVPPGTPPEPTSREAITVDAKETFPKAWWWEKTPIILSKRQPSRPLFVSHHITSSLKKSMLTPVPPSPTRRGSSRHAQHGGYLILFSMHFSVAATRYRDSAMSFRAATRSGGKLLGDAAPRCRAMRTPSLV